MTRPLYFEINNGMKVKVKISIHMDSGIPFMGPGPLQLLEKIKEHKSINKAANSMNLSYVKALNMLNRLEKGLNRDLSGDLRVEGTVGAVRILGVRAMRDALLVRVSARGGAKLFVTR